MRYLVFISFLVSVFGCVRDDKVPKNIIPQNEMRKIMWDLMRADAYVSDFIMKDSTKNKNTESGILYEKVFAIHSTTQEAFKKSMSFYESRPDLLKVISDSLKSDEKRAQESNYLEKRLPTNDTTFQKKKQLVKPLKKQ